MPLHLILRDLGGFLLTSASKNKQNLGKGCKFKGVCVPAPAPFIMMGVGGPA